MNFSTTGCWCCFLHSGPYTVAFVTYRHGWQHSRAQEANAAAVMNWVKFNTVDPSCLKVSETVANYTSHIVHISLIHLIKKQQMLLRFISVSCGVMHCVCTLDFFRFSVVTDSPMSLSCQY